MSELPVPVRVDPQTGAWSVDGQPMLLVPRHYWVFIQQAMEERLGIAAARELIWEPGFRAAVVWCEREAKTHGLSGVDVFRHYMKRMSERGYGLLTIEAIDAAAGEARIRFDHSVYVAEYGQVGRPVCYRCEGPIAGGMTFVARAAGRERQLAVAETRCVSAGDEHCLFEVRPAAAGEGGTP
ncbi:MAG: DUF5943 domain-containing protein [Alphaproteobacteria bacterium]